MTATTRPLVQLALAEVGTREEGMNGGDQVREYQAATWLAPGPWPWCAAFTCWLLREWLESDSAARGALEVTAGTLERWRCRDAKAFGWEKWAKQRGLIVLTESSMAMAGDFVVFDFSHIGVVVADQMDRGFIDTVEGNTDKTGGREGDGVWKKRRATNLVRSYLRLLP
jgi:hypothetical protein